MTDSVELHRRALSIFREVVDAPAEQQQEMILDRAGGEQRLVDRVLHLLEMDRRTSVSTAEDGSGAFRLPAEPVPQQVGPYRLLELIGEGGMGRVYRAERNDGAFDRIVAVKFIHGLSLSPAIATQFEAERRIMARLRHPNITQLLDGGTEAGRPYLVMEHVDGVPFEFDVHAPRRLQIQRFVRICHAVAHAHNNLILHRDIKPDNVLIDADGEPRLVDFGIATLAEAASAGAGTIGAAPLAMTPQYTAPECLRGEPATVASDLYSLGVLLFEVLTGRRPYDLQGTTLEQAERVIAAARQADAATGDRDLDLIIACAMHPDPAQRYASAQGLAEDLERWQERRPIQVRKDDVFYVFRRFAGRHRISVGLGAISALTIVGLLVATLLALGESNRQRELAELNASTAESAAAFLTTTLAGANPLFAGKRLTSIDEALGAAEEALEVDLQSDPDLSIYVRAALAGIFAGRGEAEKADSYATTALEALKQREQSRFASAIRASIAATFFSIGQFERSVAVADAMIATEVDRASPDWEKVIEVMSTRGEALVSLGRFEQAAEQLQHVIERLDRTRLQIPMMEARAHNGLANVQMGLGNHEQADHHSRRSIELIEAAGLLDTANGLQAQANRAGLLGLLGRIEEAESQYRRTIERMRNRFGPAHPWALWATTSFGVMYTRLGEPDRAVEVMEPLLADVDAKLAEQDETSAYFKAKLGYAMCRAERAAEGLELLEQAFAARKQIYPPDNWNLPDAEMAIGYCHMQLGNPVAARSALLNARSAFVEIYGSEYGGLEGIDRWLMQVDEGL